ncbi:MAG: hypothetical protein Q9222_004802 [Ikaeria aurantiellina]
MPPPSPALGNQYSVSPSAPKDYANSLSHFPRYGYEAQRMSSFVPNLSPSSVLSAPRSIDSSYSTMSSSTSASAYGPSSTSQGGAASTQYSTLNSQGSVPPFQPTRPFYDKIASANGTARHVDIQAKIDKGFFKTDQDWTCYRRNYCKVECSFTLKPSSAEMETLFLRKSPREAAPVAIQSFAICIGARVDGEEGKPIELVQHTPKRDKGPTGQPDKIKVLPHPSGVHGVYVEQEGLLNPHTSLASDYETPYAPNSSNNQQSQTVATFDRIQFKNATANNGKRRAAQQYFHIVVELFAEVPSNQSAEGQWVKVASRISAPMVVRGRSPGHYADDRRGSSTSMGGPGGGSSGDSAGSQRDPHSGSSGVGRSGVAGMFSNPSRLGGGGSGSYNTHQKSVDAVRAESVSDQSSTSSDYGTVEMVDYGHHQETVLTPEEEDNIKNHEGYQYYPSTLMDAPAISNVPRPPLISEPSSAFPSGGPTLPSQSGDTFGSSIPSLSSLQTGQGRLLASGGRSLGYQTSHISDSGGAMPASNGIAARGCGRFQGVDSSRGYYPATPAL